MNLLDAIKRKLSQTISGAVQAVKNIFQPKLISPIPPAPKQPVYTPPKFTYASPKAQQASIITPKPVSKIQLPSIQKVTSQIVPTLGKLYQTQVKPIFQPAISGIKMAMETPPPTFSLPQIKQPQLRSVAESIINLPGQAWKSIALTPFTGARGLKETGESVLKLAQGKKVTPQEMLVGPAQVAEAALNLYTMGKAPEVKRAISQLGKQGFLPTVIKGAKTTAPYGGAYGLIGGAETGREIPTLPEYGKHLATSTLGGLALGAGLGGVTAGGGYALQKGIGLTKSAVQNQMAEQFANDMKLNKIELTQHPVIKDYVRAFNLGPLTEKELINSVDKIRSGYIGDQRALYDIHAITNVNLPQFKRLMAPDLAKIWDYILARKNGTAPDMIPVELQMLDKSITDYAGRIVGQAGYIRWKGAEKLSPAEYRQELRNKLHQEVIDFKANETTIKKQLQTTSYEVRGGESKRIIDNSMFNQKKKLLNEFSKNPDTFIDKYDLLPPEMREVKLLPTLEGAIKPSPPQVSSKGGGEVKGKFNKDLEPLIQEARKYKTAEEFVKGKLKTSDEFGSVGQKYIQTDLPIKDIYGRLTEFPEYRDIDKRGLPSAGRQIKTPIKVSVEDLGELQNTKVQVVDGWQRLRQAIANGDETIPAKIFTDKSQLTDIWKKAQLTIPPPQVGKEISGGLPPTPAEAIKPKQYKPEDLFDLLKFREPSVPEIPPGMKERGVMRTIRTAEVTSSALKKEIEQITGKTRFYKPYSDNASLKNAQTIIATEGIDTAKNTVLKGEYNKTNVAVGEILVSKAMNEGRIEEATQILKDLSIKATNTGQANQAWSMWSRITPEGMLKYAVKEITTAKEKMGWATKIAQQAFGKKAPELSKESATIITDLMRKANKATTEEEKAKFVKMALQTISDQIPLGASEVIDAYRFNNMLSGLPTHERNFFNNVWNTFVTPVATLMAEGRPIQAVKYELGALRNIPKGLDAFVKVMKREIPIDLAKVEVGKVRFEKLPRPLTVFSELMEASDKAFSTIIEAAEVGRGISLEEAKKTATRYLLRRKIGTKGYGILSDSIDSMAEGIAAFGNKFKPIRWAVPFLRTPFDAAKMWLEYSPAGAFNIIGNQNKRNVLATTLLGSIATSIGVKLALEGRTSWAAPTDKEQKEWFYATNRKPFSVRLNLPHFGETWVPAQYFGPFAFAILLPAAAQYYFKEAPEALTSGDLDKLGKTLTSIISFWSQSSPMSGLGGFVRTMEGDLDFNIPKNIAFISSQMKPYIGMLRYITNVLDPIYRRPQGFGEQFISDIPILSKNIVDYYKEPSGEPSKREAINYFLPWAVGKQKTEYESQYKTRQQEMQLNKLNSTLKKSYEEDKPLPKNADNRMKAEVLYKELKDIQQFRKYKKNDEAQQKLDKLKKSGLWTKDLFQKALQVEKLEKAGFSKADRDLIYYEGKERAIKIKERLDSFENPKSALKHKQLLLKSGLITEDVRQELKRLYGEKTEGKTKLALPITPPKLFSATATEIGPERTPILPATTLGTITGGAGTFTQGFGARPQVYRRYGLKGHEGYDYVMPVNTSIKNPFMTAIVEKVDYDPTGYGQYVGLRNPETNEYVLLGHFNKINVKEGQKIMFNQQVGLSGGTGKTSGHSTAPHLHISYTPQYSYRLKRSGGYGGFVNPSEFLRRKIEVS